MELLLVVTIAPLLFIFSAGLWWRVKRKRKNNSTEEIHIDVLIKNGIFQPAIIKIPEEKILTIRFIRQDPTGLAGYISFPQLKLNYPLPLNKPFEVTVPPRALILGEIDFVCRYGVYAGLYQGKIFIK